MTPHLFAGLALARMRVPAALAAGVAPASLLLDPSPAAQLRGGIGSLADIARGGSTVAPVSWLALATATVVLLASRRHRSQVPIRTSRPN